MEPPRDHWMPTPEAEKGAPISFNPSVFWISLYAAKSIFNWNTLPCMLGPILVSESQGTLKPEMEKSWVTFTSTTLIFVLPILPVLKAHSPGSALENVLPNEAIGLSYAHPDLPSLRSRKESCYLASGSFHALNDIHSIPHFFCPFRGLFFLKTPVHSFFIIPNRIDLWLVLAKTQIVMAAKGNKTACAKGSLLRKEWWYVLSI